MAHVFTYGSLMYPKVWSRVVAGGYRYIEGAALGFTRSKLRGRSYPGLTPTANERAKVQGVVYLNVSPKDLARLDNFEGREYQRVSADIMVDGRLTSAWVYLWRGRFRHLLLADDWCPRTFERVYMSRFIKRYRGFMRGANSIKDQGIQ